MKCTGASRAPKWLPVPRSICKAEIGARRKHDEKDQSACPGGMYSGQPSGKDKSDERANGRSRRQTTNACPDSLVPEVAARK